MTELYISKSKYIEWISQRLQETETLDDLKDIGHYVPNFTVKKGFDEIQEFLMDVNKDNPVYFTFFVKDIIYTDSYGADQIDIKWVD